MMNLTLGHSPDSDDAFMFYALDQGHVETHGHQFEHILRDIQTLNLWALEGRLDVTAISVHGYAGISDRYAILSHGASMGDGYGPMVVTRDLPDLAALRRAKIAVPGTLTSAFLALRLYLGGFDYEVCPFDRIMEGVESGEYTAGLIIHEGQLTYSERGLTSLVDLGAWWKQETGWPLPLGVNVVRRALGTAVMAEVSQSLRDSIAYALAHRPEALGHAMRYARGLTEDVADRFVGMYVNDWTLDMGEAGRASIREFLRRGVQSGVIQTEPKIAFVD
jgi:1,4-dihydroxy-6-naphthoate synthase